MSAALRPFLPSDAPTLAAIFAASVEELTAEDYNEAQRVAWAEFAEEPEFAARVARGLTLVSTVDGVPVGFASLQGADHIEFLYVDPAVAGQGIGALLFDALEKLARARGAGRLEVDASDTARGFFERKGFVATRRNTVMRGGEWLGNTRMEKQLGGVET
jgi:putative acetyltransferase